MAGVTVTFGANIQALVEGVQDARGAIESFLGAFAVDKLADFAEQYAKLGDQIETGARQFGETTTQFQQLGYVAKMAGGDQQGLANSFARLETEIQRAQNPMSQQAAALHALGLSAKSLIGLPLAEQIGRVADAEAKLADGTNKAAVNQALFRNASGELIEVLDQGRAGIAAYNAQAERTGAIMSGQTVKSLADADHAAIGLRASLSTLSGELVALSSKSLIDLANSLTQDVAGFTKLIETGQLASYVLAHLKVDAELITMTLAQFGEALGNLSSPSGWTHLVSEWKAWQVQIEATKAAGDAALDDMVSKAGTAYKQMLAAQGATGAGGKPPTPAMDTNAAAELAASLAKMQGAIKTAEEQYQTASEAASATVVGFFGDSEAKKTAILLAALDERTNAETAAISAELASAGLNATERARLEAELTEVYDKDALTRQKILDAELKADTKAWQSALTPIESAFNSQLRSLLSGTETWGQAMKKIFADFVLSAIEGLEKLAVEKAAAGLASATGASPQGLLGSLLGQGGQAAAQTANTTAVGALTTAVLANTAALAGSSAAGAAGAPLNLLSGLSGAGGAASSAAGGGGLSSGLASLFGPLKSLFSFLPFFDVGTDMITHGGLAMVHPGEAIIPAAARGSGAFTGAGLGGGGDTHIHNWNISAVNAQSFGNMLNDHSSVLYQQIQRGFRNALIKMPA